MLAEHYLDCKPLAGSLKGRRVLILKVEITASRTMIPYDIVRFKFSIKVA